MTGIGQTTGQICLNNARELGCDLMEITAHAGARPSHAVWQGQIVSLSGRNGYLSLSDIGYGTGKGFKGWNCRHDWYPYFEGSTRMYSQKELEELDAPNVEFPDGTMHTLYEAEQCQRAFERKIRSTKRTLTACDEALNNLSDEKLLNNLQKEFEKYSVKLKGQEAELKAFCKKTGIHTDNTRMQVYGFNKSISQKAVWARNKYVAKSSKKSIIKNIDIDDYELVTYGKGVLDEVNKCIFETIKSCEESGGFIISEIYAGSIDKTAKGTPVLQIEPLPNGLLKLNINTDILSGKTLAEIDEIFKSTDSIIPNSLSEAIFHESGHAISISGKNIDEIQKMYDTLSEIHISGISTIAYEDGAECLAELEVLRSRGTKVSQEAMELYEKYMRRKY